MVKTYAFLSYTCGGELCRNSGQGCVFRCVGLPAHLFIFRRISMDEFMELLLVSGMLDENIEKSLTNNESFEDDIDIDIDTDENDDDF